MKYLKSYSEDLYNVLMDLHSIKKNDLNLLSQLDENEAKIKEIPQFDRDSIIKVAEDFLNIENLQFWENIELFKKKIIGLSLDRKQSETDLFF